MLVRDRMSAPAVTIHTETPFQEAVKLMREKGFRRLPVVDKKGHLVGIVSERDLLHASPSPASSLSIWEMNYLLWKLKIEEVMSKQVISVAENAPIEEAARMMVDRKIGGMPVLGKDSTVIGVITETDIFKTFVEMLGSGEHGLRLLLDVPSQGGVLARLSQAIYDLGGNILSVGSLDHGTDDRRRLLIKVSGVSKEQLVETLEALDDHVLDAREV